MEETKCCTVINNQYYGCCAHKGDEYSKDLYSFDETVIGTWVDSKPIYRKVITGKLAIENSNKCTFANVSDLEIDKVINLYGNMVDKNNLFQVTLSASINRPEGMYAAINMYYGMATGEIYYSYLNNKGDYSGSTAYVVIEYTKK